MSKIKSNLVFIFAILMMAGCSFPSASRPSLATPTAADIKGWAVKMTQSGGIMGLMRSVEVSSDGKYSVTDERTGKTVNGALGETELEELNELVTSASYTPPSPAGVCADCFIYEIDLQIGGNQADIQLDDLVLADSGMEPLVEYLRKFMDTALK